MTWLVAPATTDDTRDIAVSSFACGPIFGVGIVVYCLETRLCSDLCVIHCYYDSRKS
jgi:hypothetical protein